MSEGSKLSEEDHSGEPQIEEIKSKTKKGLVSLFSRSVMIYFLRGASIFLLARFLAPSDYGVFGILNSWIWGINLILPDLSMFTALIQQKEIPSKEQMRNLYGFSLYRGIVIVILVFIFGHFVIEYHQLEARNNLMFLVLAVAIFFDCLKTPFRMMIERKLDFQKVVVIEISETIVMYAVQIFSAWKGLGAWSFILAIFSRSIFGLLFYFYYEHRVYLPTVSISEIKKLFSYESMVQLKKVIIGLKGMIVPIVLGRILSSNDLGIVMWTIGISSIPVVLIHNYDRVLFPALSRLQSNLIEFKKVASKGIEMNIAVMGLLFGIIASTSIPGINLFFPSKWADAKIILPICSMAIFLSQIRYLGGSVLNARGKPKMLLKIEVLAIILEVIIAFPASLYFQSKGYFYALICLEFVVCISMYIVNSDVLRKTTLYRFFTTIFSVVVCYSAISYFLINKFQNLIFELTLSTIAFCFGYITILLTVDKHFREELKFVGRDVKRKYILRNS